jgi:hypothetical protein
MRGEVPGFGGMARKVAWPAGEAWGLRVAGRFRDAGPVRDTRRGRNSNLRVSDEAGILRITNDVNHMQGLACMGMVRPPCWGRDRVAGKLRVPAPR